MSDGEDIKLHSTRAHRPRVVLSTFFSTQFFTETPMEREVKNWKSFLIFGVITQEGIGISWLLVLFWSLSEDKQRDLEKQLPLTLPQGHTLKQLDGDVFSDLCSEIWTSFKSYDIVCKFRNDNFLGESRHEDWDSGSPLSLIWSLTSPGMSIPDVYS